MIRTRAFGVEETFVVSLVAAFVLYLYVNREEIERKQRAGVAAAEETQRRGVAEAKREQEEGARRAAEAVEKGRREAEEARRKAS